MPRLTIFLSSYERPLGLEEAIDSIKAQTFTDWRCFICDDGSADPEVWSIFEQHVPDSRFRLLSGASISPCEKRQLCTFGRLLNEGIKLTDSEYVTYINDCATYHPERCAQQIDYLEKHSYADAVWGQQEMIFYDEDGCVMRRREASPTPEIVINRGADFVRRIAGGNFIDHSSVMERRANVTSQIGWSEDGEHWTNTDWYRWQQAANVGLRFDFVGAIVGEVKHVTDDSLGARMARGETIEDVARTRGL